MEILIGVVLVAVILLLVGVDMWYFLVGGAALVALAAVFTGVFFCVCGVMLLRSRRCTGEFSRFAEGKRFEAAEYLVGARLHRNVFPAEFVLRERLYRPGKPVKLFLTRSGSVFDRNALITTLVGIPLSIGTALAFGGAFFLLVGVL